MTNTELVIGIPRIRVEVLHWEKLMLMQNMKEADHPLSKKLDDLLKEAGVECPTLMESLWI